jgi:hypothetical protein
MYKSFFKIHNFYFHLIVFHELKIHQILSGIIEPIEPDNKSKILFISSFSNLITPTEKKNETRLL